MPHRYFTEEFWEGSAALNGADAHHLGKVMRAKPGETVLLCDGHGFDYTASIRSIQPERVEFDILSKKPSETEPKTAFTLFVGYPKQDKLETIIQKSVELGAVCIQPFFSRFCVVAPKKEDQKNVRYNRIAAEAAKQSGRGILPTVNMPVDIKKLPELFTDFDLVLFCYEKGGKPLRELVKPNLNTAIITGAEGGFSPEEAELLTAAGAVSIGLGARILRCETAPVAALAAAMALCGELE